MTAGASHQKRRLLFVTNALNAGGAEQFIALHLAHIDRSLFDVSVAVLHSPAGASIEEQVRKLDVPIVDLREGRRPDPRVVPRLALLLRERKIDLVQSHVAYSNVIARVAARLTGVPVVTTEQTTAGNLERRGLDRVTRLTLPLSTGAAFISEGVKQSFVTGKELFAPRHMRVIPNGIDIGAVERAAVGKKAACEILGVSPDFTIIGCAGRLVPVKGHPYLLRAFRKLQPELGKGLPDTRLVLLGGGAEEQKLRDEARSLGISDQVVFAGHRPDVHRLLGAFDVFAMPSLQEGLGLAALEAAAAGIPIVASRTGGLPEIIEHEQTGLLVPPTDVDALADALARVLRDPELGRRMASKGRAHVQKFAIESAVAAYDDLYSACLGERA